MAQGNRQAHHQTIMPYLILNNVKGFISFAKEVFGAKEVLIHHQEGTEDIMHAEISINGSTVMMGQASEDWATDNGGMYIYVDDIDTTYETALANGATSVMPIEDKEYGRSGGIKDPYGNTWWLINE